MLGRLPLRTKNISLLCFVFFIMTGVISVHCCRCMKVRSDIHVEVNAVTTSSQIINTESEKTNNNQGKNLLQTRLLTSRDIHTHRLPHRNYLSKYKHQKTKEEVRYGQRHEPDMSGYLHLCQRLVELLRCKY